MGGNKNLHIETLRGIAILMVVLGHVIGSGTTGGLKIDYPSEWRYVYCWIDLIQMPLFTAIAGWAYSLKPIKIRLSDYFSGKFKRLIIPMMIVAPTYYLLQSLVPGTNSSQSLSEIWRIFIFSYSIYWYLPAIFLIFVIMAIVDHCKGADSLKKWSILFVVSMSAALVSQNTFIENIPNFFCFKSAINQLPYFLIGVLVNRFKDSVNDTKLVKPIVIGFFIISFYAIHKDSLNSLQGNCS